MNPQADKLKITGLLIRLVENDLNDKEMNFLVNWSRENPQAVIEYCDFLKDYSVIRSLIAGDVKSLEDSLEDSHFNEAVWKALQEVESTAPGIHIPGHKRMPEEEEIPETASPRPRSRVSKFSLYTLLAASAAMLFLIAYAYFVPNGRGIEVATLSDSLNAKWAEGDRVVRDGMRLVTKSDPLWLREGIAKLVFDNGSIVMLEGPAEFEILTEDQIELDYGRLYATVPKKAMGFTVSTANSKIIDLGTEFGVKTDPDGTEVHVIRGKTMLISTFRNDTNRQYELAQGQAKVVTATGTVRDISLKNEAFVRLIDSSKTTWVWKGQKAINLADIVGGGNGFGTGRIEYGVDPLTGKAVEKITPRYSIKGSGTYENVSWSPYIDGVFVPDGGNGHVVVSSRGDSFDDCPDTNNEFWTEITNGGQLSDPVELTPPKFRLQDRVCGTLENPAIFMHANLGITFDLQAIRAMLPRLKITGFSSLAGISENGPKRIPYADFWVLVDGQIRFSKTGADGKATYPVSIEISDSDRFLTLMVTDGGEEFSLVVDGVSYPLDGDWGLFAVPQLLIEPE